MRPKNSISKSSWLWSAGRASALPVEVTSGPSLDGFPCCAMTSPCEIRPDEAPPLGCRQDKSTPSIAPPLPASNSIRSPQRPPCAGCLDYNPGEGKCKTEDDRKPEYCGARRGRL